MRIQRFNEYNMAYDFINSFDMIILESEETNYKKIEKKVISDLKLNVRMITTFGAGMGALYPIVNNLLMNTKLPTDISPESIVLLTIAAFTIVYLEEKEFKNKNEQEELVKDSKYMLEELKMMGIGNGIVKKIIKALSSIKNIFSIISKHIGVAVIGLVDMFAYTALLIPIMNGINFIITKHGLTIDTLPQNFLGLAVGVGTIIAKHGISEIINKIKNKFPKLNKNKVLDDIETPKIQNFNTFNENPDKNIDLIKEQ